MFQTVQVRPIINIKEIVFSSDFEIIGMALKKKSEDVNIIFGGMATNKVK